VIPITEKLIEEMTNVIVREVNPQKIIAFGSFVRSSLNKDSDVDLLVIEDMPFNINRSRFQEINRIRRALSQFRVPKDILVYSKPEEEKWKSSKNHILAHCLRDGKVLYERR